MKRDMPELPEVETLRRSLCPAIVGRTLVGIRGETFPDVMGGELIDEVSRRLAGNQIEDLTRRGKYLFFLLSDGSSLLIHLRMTGRLILAPRDAPPIRFEHLALELDGELDLRFGDQRKFGRVLHILPADVVALRRRIGVEPLTARFSARRLETLLKGRNSKIKSILLDQRLIAGLGNIYVDEALHLAAIHPERRAGALSQLEISRLHRAIRRVLREGLRNRGTSFSSFEDANGERGRNQHQLRVYGRARKNLPCLRCGYPLSLLVVGGRTTHYCPTCQLPHAYTEPGN